MRIVMVAVAALVLGLVLMFLIAWALVTLFSPPSIED